MASFSKLPLLFLVLAAFHAVAAAPVPAPAPAPAQAQEYCGDTLAGLMECRSFVFGGEAVPSPACCAAYGAVYDSDDDLCLCYVDDGTFWRAAGYDVDNATGDSFRIPETCGQDGPPIEFWCEEAELPPYGRQGTPPAPALTPTAAAVVQTAQPPAPSGSSSVAAAPTFTSPPPPPPSPSSKAKRDSSPELLMLLVAIAAVCFIM